MNKHNQEEHGYNDTPKEIAKDMRDGSVRITTHKPKFRDRLKHFLGFHRKG